MGQYFIIVNLSKRQVLNPHRFDDGAKLMEFGMSSGGTMSALAVLLADGNGRGGGDLHTDDTSLVGSWAGDRIVIAGDYADEGKFLEGVDEKDKMKALRGIFKEKLDSMSDDDVQVELDNMTLYTVSRVFEDISYQIIDIMRKAREDIRCDKIRLG